jgi:hypothetical protein
MHSIIIIINPTVPPPDNVTITSSHTSTVIVGSDDIVTINLTCRAQLNTAVDVHSVMTSICWTGPNGFNVKLTGGHRLTHTTPVSVTRGGNFQFTCAARVVPATDYSGLISGSGSLSQSFQIQGGSCYVHFCSV